MEGGQYPLRKKKSYWGKMSAQAQREKILKRKGKKGGEESGHTMGRM